MNSPDKIGLLKSALKMLARQMTAQDRIAIAVYAGAAGTVLEPTAGNEYGKIEGALHRLQAGGSTNGAAGIQLAYQLAQQNFIEGGVNRVLLATDGDFNVGTTNFEALVELVKLNRESGIALTTLGFGAGNYNDHLMEQLADVGNGNYAYIDTLKEAHKVLVDERAATLLTIAKDVKIQIEFNPSQVAEYRLIGYENRALAREDFNNDLVDAGDIGAGHTVTALYEITLQSSNAKRIDPLRYVEKSTAEPTSNEIAFLRLRYKQPNESSSRLIEQAVSVASIAPSLADTSENFRFAASIAAFGQTLRGGKYLQEFDYSAIRELAGNARGDDRFGYRGEFLQLLGLAESLDTRPQSAAPDTRDDTAG
jgi:Ca-activated chloride channel family protein